MATFDKIEGKKGTKYRARVRLKIEGESIVKTKTFKKLSDAKNWARKFENEALNGNENVSQNGCEKKIYEIIDDYIEEFDTKNQPMGASKKDALKHIKTMSIAKLAPERLTQDAARGHVKLRRKTIAPSTMKQELSYIHEALSSMKDIKKFKYSLEGLNSARRIETKRGEVSSSQKKDRRPTLDELDAILKHLSSRKRASIPAADLVLFAIFSARRRGEISRFEWDKIDFRNKTTKMRLKDPNNKNRITMIAIPDRAMKIIEKIGDRDSDFVFPFKPDSVSATFERAVRDLGIDDLRFHDLRHEGASHLFEIGKSINEVAMVTGHSSWDSLKRYTHLENVEYFDKYEDFSWLEKYE